MPIFNQPGSPGGGSSAAVLHGPYPIAFNTPGLVNPAGAGIVLATFPVGSLLLGAYVVLTTLFSGGGASTSGVYATMEVGPLGNWDNNATSVYDRITIGASAATTPGMAVIQVPGTPPFVQQGGRFDAGFESFGLFVTADGVGLDSGAGAVYVMVAAPVAP